MTPETANQIWDILVADAGANESDRDQFLAAQFVGCVEYRFCGLLGLGGKLWDNCGRVYVTCYSEDMTPEREQIIELVNEKLVQYGDRPPLTKDKIRPYLQGLADEALGENRP
ncbi:MAG TPA: hypothetical protein V6C57_27370 [Coleofasciculaceae cyanobacterium]